MTIRFNNGNGGVTCDDCNALYVKTIRTHEEMEYYRLKQENGGHFCEECKIKRAIAGDE